MQNEFLPEPYGRCSEPPMLYYDSYSHSRCQLECLAVGLYEDCNCIMSYMPGKINTM